jgi:hypothetical protein
MVGRSGGPLIEKHIMKLPSCAGNHSNTIVASTTYSHFYVEKIEPSDMVQWDDHVILLMLVTTTISVYVTSRVHNS